MPFGAVRWEPCGSVVQNPGESWESHWSRSLSRGPLECIPHPRGIYYRSLRCSTIFPASYPALSFRRSRELHIVVFETSWEGTLTSIFRIELRSFRLTKQSAGTGGVNRRASSITRDSLNYWEASLFMFSWGTLPQTSWLHIVHRLAGISFPIAWNYVANYERNVEGEMTYRGESINFVCTKRPLMCGMRDDTYEISFSRFVITLGCHSRD